MPMPRALTTDTADSPSISDTRHTAHTAHTAPHRLTARRSHGLRTVGA